MKSAVLFAAAGLATAIAASSASAFIPFIIRNGAGNVPPTIQPNNAYVPGATEFVIADASMKAGWGSSDVDGSTLGGVSLSITRHDDSTRFTAGSGPAVAPYFNIWVTDGVNYAVVANEPSNPSFAAFRTPTVNGGFTYAFSLAAIAGEQCNVFEAPNAGTKSDWLHVALNKVGQTLTFADVLGYSIGAPSPSYIAGGNGIGSGAPRELGSNAAYGVNWIFGDTLANYVSGNEGYVVSGAAAVPTPGALALLGIGGLTAARRRRR
jgi:MYXO-CTERM domain-containing protein